MSEACPRCGSTMIETGAPIWESYCPINACKPKFTRTPAPPSDDLRAAMEALREGYTERFGYNDFAVIRVLKAWDAQQGERS